MRWIMRSLRDRHLLQHERHLRLQYLRHLFIELHGLKEKLTGVNEARVVREVLA